MLPQTEQYLIVGIVWVLLFSIIFLGRKYIFRKLKGIEGCYNYKISKLTYLLLGIYAIFVILNVFGIIRHKIVPIEDYVVILIVTGFIGPIAEEIVFRGFFIGFFSHRFNFKKFHFILWIIGVNVFFSLIHNLGALNPKSLIELLKTFLLGVVLTVAYYLSKKNIVYPALIHLINNVILMYFILN